MADSRESKKSRPPQNARVGWALAVIGLLVLIYGAVTTTRLLLFTQSALSADGVVVGFEERERVRWQRRRGGNTSDTFTRMLRNRRVEISYFPQVEFVTEDGTPAAFVSNVGGRSRRFAEGETVPVLYDPDDPSVGRIGEAFDLWFPSAFLGALGLTWGAVGLYLAKPGKREKRGGES